MEEARDISPSPPSRPPSSMEIVLEAIQSNARKTEEAMTSMQSSIQSNARKTEEAMQSNAKETKEVLTEVMSRLDRLEASPSPKFVVERDLNLGRSSTTEQVDAPYHSTIGLEEYGGARPKDPIVPMNPGTLRRSERLSHKAKVSYKELESRTRWPQSARLDSNPRRIASPSPPASPALPRQHEATSFDDTMWATSVEARGGVTIAAHKKI